MQIWCCAGRDESVCEYAQNAQFSWLFLCHCQRYKHDISIIHTATLFSKPLILALRILSNIISELTRASALFIFNLYDVSVTLFQQ